MQEAPENSSKQPPPHSPHKLPHTCPRALANSSELSCRNAIRFAGAEAEFDPLCRRGSRVNFMKLTLLPRRQSGSRSDKRKARGRGLPPSSGVVLSNEARVRVRSFGFVQPCCSGTLWLSDAVCLRVHCTTVPWESERRNRVRYECNKQDRPSRANSIPC